MARTPQFYHHGRSPAAWTGAAIVALGFAVAAVGSVLGPFWLLVIIGGVIVLAGCLTVMIMKVMGFGQP